MWPREVTGRTRAFPESSPSIPSPTAGEPAQHNVAPSGIKATSRGLSRKELFTRAPKEPLATVILPWREKRGETLLAPDSAGIVTEKQVTLAAARPGETRYRWGRSARQGG